MFEDQRNLCSLSSGYHAPKVVEKDLLNAGIIRRKAQEEFVNDRIKTKKVSFCYLIKKYKFKTFSTNISKVPSRTGKALAVRDLFNRVLVARESAEKDISHRVVIFFPVNRCTVIILTGWIPIHRM